MFTGWLLTGLLTAYSMVFGILVMVGSADVAIWFGPPRLPYGLDFLMGAVGVFTAVGLLFPRTLQASAMCMILTFVFSGFCAPGKSPIAGLAILILVIIAVVVLREPSLDTEARPGAF